MQETEAQALFEAGNYTGVVGLLQEQARTAREYALLGISLLRSAALLEAESPLHRAAILGDEEGTVEYGNLLRVLGRFDEACSHFEGTEGIVREPELRLRALRWWGVADFQAGRSETGLQRVERAWHGYIAMGNEELTARVTQSLAQMYTNMGQFAQAQRFLEDAIRVLPIEPDPSPRLSALRNLLDLQIQFGQLDTARGTLGEAKRTLSCGGSPRNEALLLGSEAELYRLTGEYAAYARAVEQVAVLSEKIADHQLRIWAISRLAEHQSLMGLHGRAVETLLGFGLPEAEWPPELWATDGVLRGRRGDYAGALASLDVAARAFQQSERFPQFIRVRLHQASYALRLRREVEAAALLRDALTEMLRLKQLFEFKPDFEELSELIQFAVMDPELAPYTEPLLDRIAYLSGSPRLPEDGAMSLQLRALGRAAVFRDGVEVRFAYANSPLLLAYLVLVPNRTRAEIQLDLFPERDLKVGAGYVRQCIWDLRDKLGPEVIHFEGPHKSPRYRLGRLVRVELDLKALFEALENHEVARAVSLYRGEFLPGVEEGDWVAERREEARLALTFELRSQMNRYKAQGDFRRVVLLANQLLRADPLDLEVLHERLEAARIFASAPELARYTVELNRAMN